MKISECNLAKLNSSFFIRTANCTLRLNIKNCFIRVGLTNLNDALVSPDAKILINVSAPSETYIHPSYNPSYGSRVKDVGLIKVRDQIQFERNKVRPACLDLSGSKDFSNGQLQVTAWDSKMTTRGYSNMLLAEDFRAAADFYGDMEENYISAVGLHTLGENSFFGEPGNRLN